MRWRASPGCAFAVPAESAGPTRARYLYVHAPFCARRCFYCDFAVQVRRVGDTEGWLRALAGELAWVDSEGLLVRDETLATLYVGGGTPSLLGAGAMAGLAEVVGAERLDDAELEWTAEANPESLSAEVARAWRRAGVNRLSLGVQTFHGPTLRWMGRMHGPDGAVEAVARARAAGIDNLSVDLIFGLPAHLGRDWRRDLEDALALDVPHVSLYGLSVEAATPLGRAVREGREPVVDEDRYGEEYLIAAETLVDAGYVHYEVSNFARPGAASRHNTAYWSGAPYLGLGNGAHSFAPPLRRWNLRDWEEYALRAGSGRSPEDGRELLDPSARRLERIWLGLRTSDGLALDGFGARAADCAASWARSGLATLEDGTVRLTPEGWLLLDRLSVELDEACA